MLSNNKWLNRNNNKPKRKRKWWINIMISEYDQFKEQVLNNILDLNAKDRLSRIALVKPERAVQIENYLVTVHKYK